MGKTIGQVVPDTRDPAVAYGYPAGATVLFKAVVDDVEVHFILHNAAPGTDFGNAPNNSPLFDYTDKRLYVKWGTPGATDGTWTYAAVAT